MTPPDTCPGVLRDELTPETLRVLFQRKGNTIWQDDMLELEGNRHASAWAADRARIEALERLAAAEHDRGDYLAGAEPVGGTESLYLRLDAARKEVEALATREKALCRHCGKPESNSKHTRYGPDLDNPVKHEFEPPEQTLPDELTPETLRAVFHALWHSRMLVPGPTEEDCLAHVSAWAADRRDAALEKRDKLQRAEESVVLRARTAALVGARDADWRKFVHLRDDNERIRVLGEELAQKEARIEELEIERDEWEAAERSRLTTLRSEEER